MYIQDYIDELVFLRDNCGLEEVDQDTLAEIFTDLEIELEAEAEEEEIEE